MSCTFIWYNLPEQIKNKLNIIIHNNWFILPTEVNKVLRELETTKPTCYLNNFKQNHKVNWFTTISDLQRICNILDCEEPETSNLTSFSISEETFSELGGIVCEQGITDTPTFITAYHNGAETLPLVGDSIFSDSEGTVVYADGRYVITGNLSIIVESGISVVIPPCL